jgi:hypothetical protein
MLSEEESSSGGNGGGGSGLEKERAEVWEVDLAKRPKQGRANANAHAAMLLLRMPLLSL